MVLIKILFAYSGLNKITVFNFCFDIQFCKTVINQSVHSICKVCVFFQYVISVINLLVDDLFYSHHCIHNVICHCGNNWLCMAFCTSCIFFYNSFSSLYCARLSGLNLCSLKRCLKASARVINCGSSGS